MCICVCVCVCVCVFSKRPPLSFPFHLFPSIMPKITQLCSGPTVQEFSSSTTTVLLRRTKNDCLRTSKPTLIHTHTQTHIHAHIHGHSNKHLLTQRSHTHRCPAASPPPLPFPEHSYTDTQTPLWLHSHSPRGRLHLCPETHQGVKTHTLVILISPQLTSLFNDLNPHARHLLLPLLLFIVFPVKATNGYNTTIMQLHHQ